MLKKISDGIAAGIMISIGGCVYMACENKIAGAVLFCVALLTICWKGYSLFTGKVGYMAFSHTREEVSVLLLGLLGNAIATIILGLIIRSAIPNIGEAANTACTAKLTQSIESTLIRAILCGVLMYVAVSVYKTKSSVVGILFAIPVFILAGFEHSIADMFYFAASGIVSLRAFSYLWIVILGNSLGGMLLPALESVKEKVYAE